MKKCGYKTLIKNQLKLFEHSANCFKIPKSVLYTILGGTHRSSARCRENAGPRGPSLNTIGGPIAGDKAKTHLVCPIVQNIVGIGE